jgi:hypothetical protein
MKNNFNFNKLFTEGVGYQRLSDKLKVWEKIQRVGENRGYHTRNSHTNICSRSRQTLDHFVRKTANFVALA